jgi:hypothetical protein
MAAAKNKKGITVRFEDHEMAKLEELAARFHVSSATILRWALQALAEYVELNGGKIILPVDFTNFLFPVARCPTANEGAEAAKTPLAANKKTKPSY